MKRVIDICDDTVSLQPNSEQKNLFDVSVRCLPELKRYDSLECHLVLYPYSRRIKADDYQFNPFEEYVEDIGREQRSAYQPIRSSAHQVFGLILGVVISLTVYNLQPDSLFGVEAIVSLFGAYVIGKELYGDLEAGLRRLTRRLSLRYIEPYYHYELEKHTTMTNYSLLAKKRRYQQSVLLPQKMDFIKQSNSQTVRMYFDQFELEKISADRAHLLSIQIKPELTDEFLKRGFLFGVKLSFNKHFLGLKRKYELFQSVDGGKPGCLDESGQWRTDSVFYRRTVTLGLWKWFRRSGVIEKKRIVSGKGKI